MFFIVPTALCAVFVPVVKPEEVLSSIMSLTDPYAAPFAAALFHLFVLQWLAMMVNNARVKYNVPWPTLYVDKSHPHAVEYNWCAARLRLHRAQRNHASISSLACPWAHAEALLWYSEELTVCYVRCPCSAQRAHQHVLEQTPFLFTVVAIASSEFPLCAGVGGIIFSFSKVVGNVFGYASGSSKARNRGAFGESASQPFPTAFSVSRGSVARLMMCQPLLWMHLAHAGDCSQGTWACSL